MMRTHLLPGCCVMSRTFHRWGAWQEAGVGSGKEERVSGYCNRCQLLIVLEARKLSIKGPADSVSGESLLPVSDSRLLTVSSKAEGWGSPLGSLLEGHYFHSCGLHSHYLITSQSPYVLIPSPWGTGFNRWIWDSLLGSFYSPRQQRVSEKIMAHGVRRPPNPSLTCSQNSHLRNGVIAPRLALLRVNGDHPCKSITSSGFIHYHCPNVSLWKIWNLKNIAKFNVKCIYPLH